MPDAPFSSAMHAAMAALRSGIDAGLERTCKHQKTAVDSAAILEKGHPGFTSCCSGKESFGGDEACDEVCKMVGDACRCCEGTMVSTHVHKHGNVDMTRESRTVSGLMQGNDNGLLGMMLLLRSL